MTTTRLDNFGRVTQSKWTRDLATEGSVRQVAQNWEGALLGRFVPPLLSRSGAAADPQQRDALVRPPRPAPSPFDPLASRAALSCPGSVSSPHFVPAT